MNQGELLFVDLVREVRTELIRVKYKKQRINLYESIWENLGHFMGKRRREYFDMKIGLQFLKNEYGITVFKHLSSSQGIKVRAVNMLGEYQLHGIILSKKRIMGKDYYPPVLKAFKGFVELRRRSGISENTLQSNELYLSRFSEYLSKQKLQSIRDLEATHVLGFVNTLAGTSNATVSCTLCSLRVLLRYLYNEEVLKKDISHIVPRIKIDKTARVPSAYSKKEVQKLLDIVDRGNPKGKRDYAILLLASRLGMRAGDICRLSFSNLKWEQNKIELIQEKTHDNILLPLLPEVGSAIIEYLKYGRPMTDSSTIFVRHICPITTLSAPTLHSIVHQYMQLAGINVPDGKKHGPHALRHSLASALLEENIPLPIISEVLGHKTTDTTSVYLKIDINSLRHCALDVSEYAWNQSDGGNFHEL
ncbi:MAG: tyrosine-type recombinase/integrase [Desulfobacterales bacterium]|jgi:site-specific recombinase XerD|nr:tyrosine-type recombinase/integrase [Desulfobacterales bacterium]